MLCTWQDEQCALAEFCAYVARDVVAHVDLAAEARVNVPTKKPDVEVDEDSDSDSEEKRQKRQSLIELVDVGGGSASDVEDEIDDAPIGEISGFPVYDHRRAIDLALQQDSLKRLQSKTRLNISDKQLKALDKTYGGMPKQKKIKE